MKTATFFDRIGDWINPIAVKEMRQAIKGRLIAWMLILFLLLQTVIVSIFLLFVEGEMDEFSAGRELFIVLFGVLLGVCLLFFPAVFGFRLAGERSGNNVDLLFITDLNPYSIIWGKLLAGIILTGLLFSASLPFLTLTYLLRGIDLPTIFFLVAFNYIIVILSIQAALFLGCAPGKTVTLGFRFLIGLGAAFVGFVMVIGLAGEAMSEGIGSMMNRWEFWGVVLSILGFIALGMGLLYILSVAMISPPSSNRFMGLRFYMLMAWFISGGIVASWQIANPREEILIAWIFAMAILFSFNLLFAFCERYEFGFRIRRMIPRNLLFRIFAFPFFSGAAGGVAFSVLILSLTVGVYFLYTYYFPHASSWVIDEQAHLIVVGLCLYIISYAFTSLLIKRLFLPSSSQSTITAGIAMGLMVIGGTGPMFVGWFITRDIDGMSPYWHIGNPFFLLIDDTIVGEAIFFTAIWSSLAAACNVPWFFKQARAFKPLIEDPPPRKRPIPAKTIDNETLEEGTDIDEQNVSQISS